MKTRRLVFLSVPLFALLIGAVHAQRHMVSPDTVSQWQRGGFELAWQAHAAVDSTRAGIAYLRPFVSGTRVKRVFEVVSKDRRVVLTPDQVDRFGFPLGEAEAQRQADIEMRVLQARGIEAEVKTREVPQVMLYVLSNTSVLQAIDAETGQALWTFPAGNPRYPVLRPAVNDRFAAVVNGTRLYIIDLVEGKLAWDWRLSGSPVGGPALTNQYVYVPLAAGQVEALPLVVDSGPRLPVQLGSIGRVLGPPIVTPKSVAWTTARGFMYVVEAEKNRVQFRLETRGNLVGTPAQLAFGLLYAASEDGHVFAVDESSSAIVWQYSTTESIVTGPVAIADAVYVISTNQVMHCINGETGSGNWQVPGVQQLAAVSPDRVYCVTGQYQLAILEAATGRQLGSVQLSPRNQLLTNDLTDRLYVTNGSGIIRCFREPAAEWPVIHVTPAAPPPAAEEVEAPATPPADAEPRPPTTLPDEEAMDAPVTDPFGDDDPFAPAEEPAEPFGGAAEPTEDPFGTSGDDSNDDPFGL